MAAAPSSNAAADPVGVARRREAFHRFVRVASAPGVVRAAMEDDIHHFRLEIAHDGRTIGPVRTQAIRHPYTLCPGAGEELTRLTGLPLSDNPTAHARRLNPRHQCTHLFDLAAIAMVAAANGKPARSYRASVLDPGLDNRRAVLSVDGADVLDWRMRGDDILLDEGRAVSIHAGFTDWAIGALGGDLLVGGLLLRRTVAVSAFRRFSRAQFAALASPEPNGVCWMHQPVRSARATNCYPDGISAPVLQPGVADDPWLAFA